MSILYLASSQTMSAVRRRAPNPVSYRVRTFQLATTRGLSLIEEFILYFLRPRVGYPCGCGRPPGKGGTGNVWPPLLGPSSTGGEQCADPKKGCSVTLVAAEEGCCSIPITQRPSDHGRLRAEHELEAASSIRVPLPPWGAAEERSEFNIKPPLGAPLQILPRGYLLKSFPRVDTSARQRGFEISVFPLLNELPKAIEPHLPVCQLYRWQLGPSMWTSPTTKSLDPIVVTALRVGFPGESHRPATCGFAYDCPEPEAWTTEA